MSPRASPLEVVPTPSPKPHPSLVLRADPIVTARAACAVLCGLRRFLTCVGVVASLVTAVLARAHLVDRAALELLIGACVMMAATTLLALLREIAWRRRLARLTRDRARPRCYALPS